MRHERDDRYPLCLAVCVALVVALRLCLISVFPEDVPFNWRLERLVLGALLDCGPLFALSLSALFWKTRLLGIFSAVWLLFVLAWNAANCFLIHTARRIIDYDILLQVLPEVQHALNILPQNGTLFLAAGTGGIVGLTVWLIRSQWSFSLRHARRGPATLLLVLVALSALGTAYYSVTLYDMERRRGWMSVPVWKNAWDIWRDYRESVDAVPVVPPREPLAADKEVMTSLGLWRTNPPQAQALPIRNIILVAVESLNLDFLHRYNALIPAEATPNFDALAARGLAFRNFYTSAMPTVRGLHALLSSRLSYEDDLGSAPNLFTSLKSAGFSGYYLSAVSGQWGRFIDSGSMAFSRRYNPDHIRFREYFEDNYAIKSEKWGIESFYLFREALDILQKHPDGKSFIVISTIETHSPFNTPTREDEACARIPVVAGDPFLRALCAQDRSLGHFLHGLEPHLDDTLLVLTADHSSTNGAEYMNRKFFTVDRIPLVFLSRQGVQGLGSNGQEIDSYCAQIDLGVTLLNLMGLPVPDTFMGNDIRLKKVACSLLEGRTVRLRDQRGECIANRKDVTSLLGRWFQLYYPNG